MYKTQRALTQFLYKIYSKSHYRIHTGSSFSQLDLQFRKIHLGLGTVSQPVGHDTFGGSNDPLTGIYIRYPV